MPGPHPDTQALKARESCCGLRTSVPNSPLLSLLRGRLQREGGVDGSIASPQTGSVESIAEQIPPGSDPTPKVSASPGVTSTAVSPNCGAHMSLISESRPSGPGWPASGLMALQGAVGPAPGRPRKRPACLGVLKGSAAAYQDAGCNWESEKPSDGDSARPAESAGETFPTAAAVRQRGWALPVAAPGPGNPEQGTSVSQAWTRGRAHLCAPSSEVCCFPPTSPSGTFVI